LAVPAGLLLGERLQTINWFGVVCLLAGIWIARRPARGQAATLPALLAGAFIACYSAIDTEGVHLVPPWLYGWGIWVGGALMLQAWVWLTPRLPTRRHGGNRRRLQGRNSSADASPAGPR